MDNKNLDKITIIIYTFNRYSFLLRLLEFYELYDFPMKILILDSSSDVLDNNKLQKLLEHKKITYQKFSPDITASQKIVSGLKNVTTPYTVICADDDFIIPGAIEDCINFLEQNLDYSIAHGLYCSHYLRKNKNGKIKFCWVPTEIATSITYDKPSERLQYHLSHYTGATFYAVHRTALIQLMWEELMRYTSDVRFGEILPSALSLIYGKMMVLPIFYASREFIPNPPSKLIHSWVSLIKRDDFQHKCEKVIDCLTYHLSKQECINKETATKIAAESLQVYLRFTEKYNSPTYKKLYNLSKNVLEKCRLKKLTIKIFHFIKQFYNLKNFQLNDVKKEYADILEKENSRFYPDFNKIKGLVIKYQINVQNF